MAETQGTYESVDITEISIDLEALATQSELYGALLKFHGKDAIHILSYPSDAPFSKHCFISVVECLGNKKALFETLHKFEIRDLFLISLYLGSDTLLYHIVFDMLRATNSVSILDMTTETLGVHHFITKGVTHFIMMVLNRSYREVTDLFGKSKHKLRKMLKNSVRFDRSCILPDRMPIVCLCCTRAITDELHQKEIKKRLAPMRCCGMMTHLQCQLTLFSSKIYPKCPACKTIFSDGEIDLDLNMLDSLMTRRYLENYGIHPIPYRSRPEIWKTS